MTYKSNVSSILNKNNIAIGPKDIVEPDLQSNVKTGDTIKIRKAINVQLAIGKEVKKVLTAADTVEEMLSQEKIALGKEDKISVPKEKVIKNGRSEEHTSELQSRQYLVCRLLLEKK